MGSTGVVTTKRLEVFDYFGRLFVARGGPQAEGLLTKLLHVSAQQFDLTTTRGDTVVFLKCPVSLLHLTEEHALRGREIVKDLQNVNVLVRRQTKETLLRLQKPPPASSLPRTKELLGIAADCARHTGTDDVDDFAAAAGEHPCLRQATSKPVLERMARRAFEGSGTAIQPRGAGDALGAASSQGLSQATLALIPVKLASAINRVASSAAIDGALAYLRFKWWNITAGLVVSVGDPGIR